MKTNKITKSLFISLLIVQTQTLLAESHFACSAECLIVDYRGQSITDLGALTGSSKINLTDAFADLNENCQKQAYASSCQYHLGDPVILARSMSLKARSTHTYDSDTWTQSFSHASYPYGFENFTGTQTSVHVFHNKDSRLMITYATAFDRKSCKRVDGAVPSRLEFKRKYCGDGTLLP